MLYIQTDSEDEAKQISSTLWKLTVPASFQASTVARHLFSWLKHPEQKQWVVEFDDSVQLNLHPKTVVDLVDSIDRSNLRAELQTAFSSVSKNAVQLETMLRAEALQKSNLATSVFTDLFQDTKKLTRAEAEAAGWFPEPKI